MTDFEAEIAETSTEDLLVILEDQRELYTQEELEVIRRELEKRNTVDVAYSLKRARRLTETEGGESGDELQTDEDAFSEGAYR